MKKLVVLLSICSISSVFASGAVANAVESVAMTDCLKTKTQLECNAMQKAGNKAVQAEKK